MTAKEKAEELINKFIEISPVDYDLLYTPEIVNTKCLNDINFCKKCALICVDEVIKEHCKESENKNPIAQDRWISFWIEVKQELEKL